jgi:hypothetical protein
VLRKGSNFFHEVFLLVERSSQTGLPQVSSFIQSILCHHVPF